MLPDSTQTSSRWVVPDTSSVPPGLDEVRDLQIDLQAGGGTQLFQDMLTVSTVVVCEKKIWYAVSTLWY